MKKTIGTVIGIGLLLLLGCAAPTPTPTPTPEPTPTVEIAPTVANLSPKHTGESLAGIWETKDKYARFTEDGHWYVSYKAETLDTSPFDWGTYTLEDMVLTLHTDEDAYCEGQTGIYEVEFTEDGSAILTLVDDPCVGRVRDIGNAPLLWY